MSEVITQEPKYCQSCIERGYKPPQLATREWTPGVFYCDDCFAPLLSNLAMINEPEAIAAIPKMNGNKPFLKQLYEQFGVPPELQFEGVDQVCKNHEKFFTFFAPAVVNKSLDELALHIDEMATAMFVIKYSYEPHQLQIGKLKEEARKEKNLKGLDDSREAYSKPKKTKTEVEDKKLESMAKAMGITVNELKDRIKGARQKEFDKLVGGCTCSGIMPDKNCPIHKGK